MNNSYYETLDENFNEALKLVDKPLSHEELIYMLQSGNIPQKQLAALRLETLKSKEDAETLLNNLVGQDGKIREAVSLKIMEFSSVEEYKDLFLLIDENKFSDYILAAIIDINGNICRNILNALDVFKYNKNFSEKFIQKLLGLISTLLDKIEEFDLTDGKYKINKEIFKLYWCLEAVNLFYNQISLENIKAIIKITKDINEYTIREKTAKILSHEFEDKYLLEVKEALKKDKNYYVRRF